MFKISNQNQVDGQGQSLDNFPIHTMKKDLEEINNPSATKISEQDASFQENYVLNDTQKSSPFLSLASQPGKMPASIKFRDELSEQHVNEDRMANQRATEKRIAEQKAEIARKIAEERKMTEQKETEQEAAEERKRTEEKKIIEERLAKQKAAMAQKIIEENAKRKKQMLEQREAATPTFVGAGATKALPSTTAESDNIKISKNINSESKSKNIIYLIVSITLVLLIAGGGYYFWITRQQKEPSVVIIPEPQPKPEPTPEPEPIPATTFSTDKPNYLVIDQPSPTAGEIKTTLKKYSDEIILSGITLPVEFVVVDAQNNPILFSAFANSFSLKLSPAIIANLNDTFSLFIYNDENSARLGLTIDSKNDTLLKTAMSKEGKNIISETMPLFMDNSFENPVDNAFNKYLYNNIELYYINLLHQGLLASNYGILNKTLLIGTSKKTMFSMVDYLKNSNEDSEAGTE